MSFQAPGSVGGGPGGGGVTDGGGCGPTPGAPVGDGPE